MSKTGKIVEAILEDITVGRLKGGDRVDSERALIRRFGVSLGTAQRALKELQHLGVLVREHGRGTFVKKTEATVFDARFIRFKTDEDVVLPIHAAIISIRRKALGRSARQFFGDGVIQGVHITRRLNVGGRFELISEFVLTEPYFDHLLAANGPGVAGNIRENLAEALVLPGLQVEQSICYADIPSVAARLLSLDSPTMGFCIAMRATAAEGHPIYLQTVFGQDFGGARLVIDR